MDWFIVCAFINMHFLVQMLFGIHYRDQKYDMLKQKEHVCKNINRKKLTKKQLWIFEWPKMSHIFISPYHNHFWVDFNFSFLTCTLKNVLKWFISIWTF
jgi:hypothetical protein